MLMTRRQTRRPMFIIIIGGAVLMVLALIAGAVLLTYQITINAHAVPGSASTAPASGSANAIQATPTTNKAAQQPVPAATATAPVQIPANPTASTTQSNANTFAQPLKSYGPQIQHMVAQGLNVPDKELATQLQAGKHLKDIAQVQGISNTQLQTLISTSITNSFAPAVQGGLLTQTQVSSFVTQTQQNPQMLEQTLSIAPPPRPHW